MIEVGHDPLSVVAIMMLVAVDRIGVLYLPVLQGRIGVE